MDASGLKHRGGLPTGIVLKVPLPGQTAQQQVAQCAQQQTAQSVQTAVDFVGDPFPTTKGAGMTMMFSEWTTAILKAPYHMPNVPFRISSFLITLLLTFILGTALAVAVPVVVTYSGASSNALPVAVVTFGVLLMGMSVRAADHLPQLMHPALVFAVWLHGKLGLIVSGPMLLAMFGAGAVSAPILAGIHGTTMLNYGTGTNPLTYWGAVALQTSLVTFSVYMFLQNTAVTHYYLAEVRGAR
jgi:hypothetical protein